MVVVVVGVAKGDGDGDIVFGRERDAMLESRRLRVNCEGERRAQSRELHRDREFHGAELQMRMNQLTSK